MLASLSFDIEKGCYMLFVNMNELMAYTSCFYVLTINEPPHDKTNKMT